MTWEYPELTNYQYASNEPIANVDRDGLEESNVLDPASVGGAAGDYIRNLSSQGMTNITATSLDNGKINIAWSDPCMVDPPGSLQNVNVKAINGNFTGGISTPSDIQNLSDWGRTFILQPLQRFDNFMRTNEFLWKIDNLARPLPEATSKQDNNPTSTQPGGLLIYAEGHDMSFQKGSTATFMEVLNAGNMFGLLHGFGAPGVTDIAPEGGIKNGAEVIEKGNELIENGTTIKENVKGGNKNGESKLEQKIPTKYNPPVDKSQPKGIFKYTEGHSDGHGGWTTGTTTIVPNPNLPQQKN